MTKKMKIPKKFIYLLLRNFTFQLIFNNNTIYKIALSLFYRQTLKMVSYLDMNTLNTYVYIYIYISKS